MKTAIIIGIVLFVIVNSLFVVFCYNIAKRQVKTEKEKETIKGSPE
ncbi:MAG TPA: hypothetical protein VIK55_11095 [Paludibacter sp.]